ncbi:MAG: 3,8-cyclase [Thermosediminibacterales bacterium]|nr:3,8-cyclase [Thermosediminibacterales bacterium]MDK2835340.1 3,8-cyclase [Thermosediminibacterales bacterium]
MLDKYGRNIEYMRISITDRCNFRCRYCMPKEGVVSKKHDEILSFEEFERVVKNSVKLGIDRIRITGGEPLVRKGVEEFIHSLKQIPGLKDVSMTTNGSLLAQKAEKLARAGLDRVNISLDSLNPSKFKYITRLGRLQDVIEGIHAALKAGLDPVKINCVVTGGFNDDEIEDFVNLTIDLPLHVRFIELMPLSNDLSDIKGYVSNNSIKKSIKEKLLPAGDVRGSGPANYYKVEGAKGSIGFISPMSEHFCYKCNRIRLTADGKLKPCLESDIEFDVKELLRSGASDKEIQKAIIRAIEAKPAEHHMIWGINKKHKRGMSQIGG